MEYLIEFILDLILEGSVELSSNKKVPKWIRYPLIVFLIIFFLVVIIGTMLLGILVIEDNKLIGIFLITIGLIFLILSIYKFKKIYLKNSQKK